MKLHYLLFLLVFLVACSNKEDSTSTPKKYFDVSAYFEKEAAKLQKLNPAVEKSVSQNNESEQKQVKISDWITEFKLFIDSDINKPAWQNSYRIIKNDTETQYLSTDSALRTKKIQISLSKNGDVKLISITNKTSNILYTSTEELTYYPDSLYRIIKNQNVMVIGKNSYIISAKF